MEWKKMNGKKSFFECEHKQRIHTNISRMEMTVSVRQFYTHSVEFTIIHVGRSNVCNFNIHHHLLVCLVITAPIHTDRLLVLSAYRLGGCEYLVLDKRWASTCLKMPPIDYFSYGKHELCCHCWLFGLTREAKNSKHITNTHAHENPCRRRKQLRPLYLYAMHLYQVFTRHLMRDPCNDPENYAYAHSCIHARTHMLFSVGFQIIRAFRIFRAQTLARAWDFINKIHIKVVWKFPSRFFLLVFLSVFVFLFQSMNFDV